MQTTPDTSVPALVMNCLALADPLEVGDRLDDGNDQSKVACRRTTSRKNSSTLLVNTDFEFVDLVIVPGHPQAEFTVPTHNRRNGIGQLCLHKPAHGQNAVTQAVQVLVEATRYVISKVGGLHNEICETRRPW
jgi:hypothetical protein